MTNNDILNLPLDHDDFNGRTIRDYLRELLLKLWEEDEGFSGKRPFGNSGWQYDLFKPLVKHGEIGGEIDEWGDMVDCDIESGYTMICTLINYVFKGE